jgi:hypothetical protein
MRMIFGAIGGMKIGRGNRSTRRKPTTAPLCPPQNPTWQTRSRTPDRSGGKPATNRLTYGVALFSPISSPLTTRRVTVEVFDPASTRAVKKTWLSIYGLMVYFLICYARGQLYLYLMKDILALQFNILSCFKCVTIDGVLDYWIYWQLTDHTTNNYITIAISTLYSSLLHAVVFSVYYSLHYPFPGNGF